MHFGNNFRNFSVKIHMSSTELSKTHSNEFRIPAIFLPLFLSRGGENAVVTTHDEACGYRFSFQGKTKWRIGEPSTVCNSRDKVHIWQCFTLTFTQEL